MITRYEGTDKVADVTGDVTASDLDNAKTQAVNESKQYTNTQVNNNKPKKTSTNVTMANGNQVHCERYGDVVCLTMNDTGSGTLQQSGTSRETIKVGYRPATAVSTLCRYGVSPSGITDTYIDNIGFLTVNTDGTVSWAFSTKPTGPQRWTWSISYITNDTFPS